MDKLDWIKQLVLSEEQVEETGMIDMSAGYDPEKSLESETVEFLKDLKLTFVDAASAFNQLKSTALGKIKIYGISNTRADFMLFRNGYKLIFTMTQPGTVACRLNHIGTNFVPGGEARDLSHLQEHILQARWGAFGDLTWTYREQPIKLDYLVRYYMSRFVKESTK